MFTKVMSRKLITLEKKYYFCPLTTRNVENLSQIIWFSLKIKGNYDILSSTGFLLLFLCMTSLFTPDCFVDKLSQKIEKYEKN